MPDIPVPGPDGSAVTEAEVVAYITSKWGAAKAAQFKAWYAAALKKDPGLTPATAAEIWIVGEGVSGGIGKVGEFTAVQVPTAAAGAAAKALTVNNPLDWLSNIGQFFSALTQANTWLRVSKVLMGGVLVIAGLMKLTGTSPTVYGIAGMAAKKLTTAVEGGGR